MIIRSLFTISIYHMIASVKLAGSVSAILNYAYIKIRMINIFFIFLI